MDRKDKVEGEGSYSGSKDYNQRTEKFVQSGKVDEAARAAKPQSEEEAHQMSKAERIGKQHAKGEDPALNSPASGSSSDRPTTGSGDRSGRSR